MSQNDVLMQEIDNLSALYALRDAQAAKLKDTESHIAAVERGVLAAMNAASIITIGGRVDTATIHTERVYRADNWPALYDRIRMTGEFDLLHRRLHTTALREREQAGDLPPGVVAVNLQRLKLAPTKT
jgi:hypothetical protein